MKFITTQNIQSTIITNSLELSLHKNSFIIPHSIDHELFKITRKTFHISFKNISNFPTNNSNALKIHFHTYHSTPMIIYRKQGTEITRSSLKNVWLCFFFNFSRNHSIATFCIFWKIRFTPWAKFCSFSKLLPTRNHRNLVDNSNILKWNLIFISNAFAFFFSYKKWLPAEKFSRVCHIFFCAFSALTDVSYFIKFPQKLSKMWNISSLHLK